MTEAWRLGLASRTGEPLAEDLAKSDFLAVDFLTGDGERLAGDGDCCFFGVAVFLGDGDRFGDGERLAEAASLFFGELLPEALAGEDLAGELLIDLRGDDFMLRGGDLTASSAASASSISTMSTSAPLSS